MHSEMDFTDGLLNSDYSFFLEIFDGIRDGINVVDTDLNILRVNKWVKSIHHDQLPLEGKKCFEILFDRLTPCADCPSLKTLVTGKVQYEDKKICSANGVDGWIRLTSFPMKNSHGQIIGAANHLRDITDLKVAEEEIKKKNETVELIKDEAVTAKNEMVVMYDKLKDAHDEVKVINKILQQKVEEKTDELNKQNQELQLLNQELIATNQELTSTQEDLQDHVDAVDELVKQKDEFIHMLGHDLKNPMTSIFTLLPLIERKSEDPKAKDMMKRVVNSAKRMREIIDETLKLARLTDVGRSANPIDFSLLDAINTTIEHNLSLIETYNLNVETRIDEKIHLWADRFQFEELITNFLTNAVKYTPEDKNGVFLIEASLNNSMVTLSFSDNGVGMTMAQLNRVFDKFYTSGTPREGLTSSGLGLSICKQIVEKHQGKIWAESKGPGMGSTFYVSIPIKKRDT